MLFKWILSDDINKKDQFMFTLFDHGIMSARQFCILAGWKESVLRGTMYRIGKDKAKSDRKKWISNYVTSYKLDHSYYMLGEEGVKYCIVQLGQSNLRATNFLISISKQDKHSLGLNEIVVRLVQSGIDRSHINWLATLEATESLHRLKQRQQPDITKREIIHPDARLILGIMKYWIEFDNGTEGATELEKKLVNYVETLKSLNDRWIDHHGKQRKPLDASRVLWVTNDAERRDYLQRIWKQVKYHYYKDQWVPQMEFFKEGEDTAFLLTAWQTMQSGSAG